MRRGAGIPFVSAPPGEGRDPARVARTSQSGELNLDPGLRRGERIEIASDLNPFRQGVGS